MIEDKCFSPFWVLYGAWKAYEMNMANLPMILSAFVTANFGGLLYEIILNRGKVDYKAFLKTRLQSLVEAILVPIILQRPFLILILITFRVLNIDLNDYSNRLLELQRRYNYGRIYIIVRWVCFWRSIPYYKRFPYLKRIYIALCRRRTVGHKV